MQPVGSLDTAHFVVVRLRAEDESRHPELGVVSPRPASHHAPEVGSVLAGVQGQVPVLLLPRLFSQLPRQEVTADNVIEVVSLLVMPLKDSPSLHISAGYVVGVMVVAVLVGSEPVPIPPLLRCLVLESVDTNLLRDRMRLSVLSARGHFKTRGGAECRGQTESHRNTHQGLRDSALSYHR